MFRAALSRGASFCPHGNNFSHFSWVGRRTELWKQTDYTISTIKTQKEFLLSYKDFDIQHGGEISGFL
jgi:hypothetical protein